MVHKGLNPIQSHQSNISLFSPSLLAVEIALKLLSFEYILPGLVYLLASFGYDAN